MNSPELKFRTIVGAAPGPHMLFTGGVHGDEFEPMVALRELLRQLRPEELHGSVTVIPVVNEPAFERRHRTADDGLDLARTCPGNPTGSITERIAHAVSGWIQRADFYCDLHTGGTGLTVLPLAGYCLHSDPAILDRQRQMARACNLPVVWGTDPNLNGRTLSVARDARVPAIYCEYEGSAVCSPVGVAAYIAACFNLLAAVGMLDRPIVAPPADQRFIEDGRPNAGYLQICNPAPCSGYFETNVRLGDQVRVGDLLGTITDPLGDVRLPVVSQQSGWIVTLRTFPRVAAGEMVAVVLEDVGGGS